MQLILKKNKNGQHGNLGEDRRIRRLLADDTGGRGVHIYVVPNRNTGRSILLVRLMWHASLFALLLVATQCGFTCYQKYFRFLTGYTGRGIFCILYLLVLTL